MKNKLDGQMYAIKRIPLNPKSQHFNKKITREVKLLSRLNHENVVRLEPLPLSHTIKQILCIKPVHTNQQALPFAITILRSIDCSCKHISSLNVHAD